MGTMRNRHGDSVVAMDTPDGSMAVELTRSRLNGSSRHAVMTASSRGSCRSRSQRSRGQDRRSARISFSSDSECSLPEVAIHHHSLGGSNGSRTGGGTSQPCTSSDHSSELGSIRRPIRALVATFQAAAEQVLLSTFMHMQVSVIVEFAVGVPGLHNALVSNQEVRSLVHMACMPQQATVVMSRYLCSDTAADVYSHK